MKTIPLPILCALGLNLIVIAWLVWKNVKLSARLVKHTQFVRWVIKAPVSSGVCCCGGTIVPAVGCGSQHGSIDSWDYELGNWCKDLDELK